MCSQGFNRYPNDILKLSFSYAWGVISIWKWYLWKGLLGSPEKSGILTLLHCSCPHDICMCRCESILTRMCPVPSLLYHFLPILLRRDLSLKPGTPVFLVSLDARQLQRSSRGSPPGGQGYRCVQGAQLVMWVLTFRLWSSSLLIEHP